MVSFRINIYLAYKHVWLTPHEWYILLSFLLIFILWVIISVGLMLLILFQNEIIG